MCGLTGYITKKRITINHAQVLKDMLTLQAHRGPDDSGTLSLCMTHAERLPLTLENATEDYNLYIGFNRLSILDLSYNGHQPMVSEDRKIVLMMNGEIYNAFSFKEELIAKGFSFKSTTDTEVVLRLYQAYGFQEMISRLNGMFAIVLYDANQQKLFLARDRFGIKPLYLFENSNYFTFSSEIKSFTALPELKLQLDENGLDEYVLFRNRINDTLFKGIQNLTPGTYLEIDSTLQKRISYYYDVNEIEGQISASVADIENWLQTSVNSQLLSDVKLGCQLSGGIDSSLVSYFAQKKLEQGRLETISIVFNEPNYTEKKYIDYVAQQLKLRSHQYVLDGSLFLENFSKATWHLEQPLNHPNTIGIYELSKQAVKHVTVLLSGEGADEIFGGYSRFWLSNNVNHQLRYLIRNKDYAVSLLPYIMSKGGRTALSGSFGNISNAASIYKPFHLKTALENRVQLFETLKGDAFQVQRKYELKAFLPDLLMRQDKMSMAWNIENRVPFLDNILVENALRIGKRELIKNYKGNWEGKFLLKKLGEVKFSHDFAFRTKMGFTIPLKQFFLTESFRQQWMEEIYPGIKQRGIFDAKQADWYFKQVRQLNQAGLDALWQLMAFENWAKQYKV